MWWWHYFNFTERSIPITNRNRYAMRQNYLAVWKMLSYWQKCVQAGPVALFWKPWLRILKKSSYKAKFHLINGMLYSNKKEILKVIVMKNILGKMGIIELMPQVTESFNINQLNYSIFATFSSQQVRCVHVWDFTELKRHILKILEHTNLQWSVCCSFFFWHQVWRASE